MEDHLVKQRYINIKKKKNFVITTPFEGYKIDAADCLFTGNNRAFIWPAWRASTPRHTLTNHNDGNVFDTTCWPISIRKHMTSCPAPYLSIRWKKQRKKKRNPAKERQLLSYLVMYCYKVANLKSFPVFSYTSEIRLLQRETTWQSRMYRPKV